ncbi:MAG: PH domain-containing protein [Candidatus Nanopelagicales bacterium]
MSYLESLLANNEKVVYETHKHWIAPFFATVTGSLFVIGGLAALVGTVITDLSWLDTLLLWGGLLALLVGVVMVGSAFVAWWSEHYFVTNQKVLKVSGILNKSADGSALEKINDITIEEPLVGRWLGFGTLRVSTAADQSDITYTAMRKPMEFRRAILNEKQLFEQQDARTIAEAVLAAQQDPALAPLVERPSAQEITDTIARLAVLRDSGAITPEDFEAKKVELLGQL